MDPILAAITNPLVVPAVGAAAGLAAGGGLYLAGRSNRREGLILRFLAAAAISWAALCLAYVVASRDVTFQAYLLGSPLVACVVAAAGMGFYILALMTFQPGDRQWRQSASLLAGVAMMAAAFIRAAYQPSVTLWVQAPLALLFIATVWRFGAELLVYVAILALAVTAALAGPFYLMDEQAASARGMTASAAAGVSLAMTLAGAALGMKRQEFTIKWYRQGFLIVPLVVSTLAAAGAGALAVWYGATWHTVWALGAWWAVLLVGSIGLKQPDLFGFSSVGAGMTAVAVFAVLGGTDISGYWGRYPAVLVWMAMGIALLAALLAMRRLRPIHAFARALYLAAVTIAIAGLAIEPIETTHVYLGLDFLVAAAVLALAHPHGVPSWVNYLVAAAATAGMAALAHVPLDSPGGLWHHRFILVMAGCSVAWLLAAILVRALLRATSSYRTARREVEPFVVFGMVMTLVLAGSLTVQEVRTYAELMIDGTSPTQTLLGPGWGLLGWAAVMMAFTISMWLLRHTVRTVLFYCLGITATVYLGLFIQAQSAAEYREALYSHLIYAIAGYGAAHLLVFLYEARFMAVLSRLCAFYREEQRASTTIFTLANTSCGAAAVLALLRLDLHASLVMLGIMAIVFLVWSFVWLRSQMLYPAVLIITLAILSVWHNMKHPAEWDPYRLGVNAAVLTFSAIVWLAIGNRLHSVRGEIFELAGPARACSLVLALVGSVFAVALAISPTFPSDVWRAERLLSDWALGLSTMIGLAIYYAWAGHVASRRIYQLATILIVLLLGLYVGIYVGFVQVRF